ncbi:MAG: hypothetical protein KAJ21_04510 [Thermoplasmatales archaeon]|nr:hypothetical protein [Thermoplasmatales archaeon]
MKKYFIEIGAILIALLLMSTVTAVPQTQSKPAMEIINDIEDKINLIESNALTNIINNVETGGIIELLIQLITVIIQFIIELIGIIQNIIGLVNLIDTLIAAFTTLFQLIQDLIELIRSIFNPEQLISN